MENESVLVIDDDDSIRETLILALESAGYHVIAASNGREALELLERIPRPRLILLDLMMPVMDGREFVSLLAKNNTFVNIPIVLLTAAVDRAQSVDHVAGILKKPLNLNSLFETVERYCGVRSENGSSPNPRRLETPAARLE